jgi:predicted protein tyrosine phosphatase
VFRAYHPDLWVRSCGSDSSATIPVNKWLLEWADLVVCFEKEHVDAVNEFDHDKEIVCLGIKDNYCPNDPELVVILKARMPQFIDPLLARNAPGSHGDGPGAIPGDAVDGIA